MIAQTTEALAAALGSLADAAQQARQLTATADQEAAAGSQTIEETAAEMEAIAAIASEAAGSVEALVEQTQRIGSIARSIWDPRAGGPIGTHRRNQRRAGQ